MELRSLPAVDGLVRRLAPDGLPRGLVVGAVRDALDEARRRIAGGEPTDPEALARAAVERLVTARHRIVVNATGVLLHTNLGRAPLAQSAADEAHAIATRYANVELDLGTGRRGGRAAYLHRLLADLCGAEAALAVNNNAAALFLSLMAVAAGREVPVSRGELIEIGGSYRLPELMAATGARMVEVGTTNRTHLDDYLAVLGPATGAILKVHPSNYRIEGFAADVPVSDLAGPAAAADVPLIYDVGSGLLDERAPWLDGPPPRWLAGEPGVRQALAAGADLVCFSGDKLFGGPQAGIVVGRADLVDRLRRHPAARAMRIDGPTVAALTVTAEAYADDRAQELPFWRMATLPTDVLRARSERVLEPIPAVDGERRPSIVDDASVVGAGSVPGTTIEGPAIRIPDGDAVWRHLLDADPPILGRRKHGALLIDLRTVFEDQDAHVARSLAEALGTAWRS